MTMKFATKARELATSAWRGLRTTTAVESDSAGVKISHGLVPIAVVLAWWLGAYAMYISGWPIPYTRQNSGEVSLLALSTLLLTAFVSFVAIRRRALSIEASRPPRIPRYVLFGLVLSLLLVIPLAETYSGYHVWELWQALNDQGAAFSRSSERIAEGTSSRLWIVVVQSLSAPFTMVTLPYFSLTWLERRKHFWLFALCVLVPIVQSILVGRDFQIVITGVLVGCMWMISRARRKMFFSRRDATALVGAALVFLVAFGARKLSRNPGIPICQPGAIECNSTDAPNLWDSITGNFASYASQSFEGLGRALNGVWEFGGGFSHSPALNATFHQLAGAPTSRVITDQLDSFGWSATYYWSTGLTWIANDVPWVLVPVIVAIQALLLAATWRASIRNGDWLSITVFGYSWLSLFFMMQNLQIAISGPIYIGYLTLVAVFIGRWLLRGVRARRKTTPPSPEAEVKAISATAERL